MILVRRFTLADQLENRHPTVEFEVPAGVDSFEVRLDFDRSLAVVDLGCEAPPARSSRHGADGRVLPATGS